MTPQLVSIGAAVAGIVLNWWLTVGLIGGLSGLAAMTVILLVYLVLQALIVRAECPKLPLVNPVVLASVVTFGICYGITNAAFLLPSEALDVFGMANPKQASMVKQVTLALLAAIAMWEGYRSPLAKVVSRSLVCSLVRKRVLSRAQNVHAGAIASLVLVSSASRIAIVHFGLFGYSSSAEAVSTHSDKSQILALFARLGDLALLIASLQFFRQPRDGRSLARLAALVVVEVAWGFLSGFKSQVVMPFVILGVARYVATGRLPRWSMAGAILALAIAYQVIEPFRVARSSIADYDGTRISSIVGTMVSARAPGGSSTDDPRPGWLKPVISANLTHPGAFGIEFCDAGLLIEDDPSFLRRLLFAPVYSWTPRFLEADKPLGNLGNWYFRTVLGGSGESSSAMGPITYLYFAGGWIAVAVMFYTLGAFHFVVFFALRPWQLTSGAVVFTAILRQLVEVNSSVDAMVIGLCRDLPILLMLQYFLFPRR